MQLTISMPESQQAVRFPAEVLNLGEEEFFHFCQANRDMRIERSAQGEITVMSPAGGYSGYQSGEVFSQLKAWASRDRSGVAFDSSTGFLLPNGSMRAPDAAWVELSRLQMLSRKEKERFIPLCPDFVIEVASHSDDVASLRNKMNEYRECGLRLGWLILPSLRQIEVYTSEKGQTLTGVEAVSGDPVLPGFRLELALVWAPPF